MMARLSIKGLQAQLVSQQRRHDEDMAEMKAKMDALLNARSTAPAPATKSGIKVITSADGLSFGDLFSAAMESKSYVSYGAVAQSLDLDHTRLYGETMEAVITAIEDVEADHLVVSAGGRYGRGVKAEQVAVFHSRLDDLGYTDKPGKAKPKPKKKGKAKTDIDVANVAKIVAAVMAAS
jgi:hypothetical protein